MTDWRTRLREADRAHEARSAPAELGRIRQTAVAAARRSERAAAPGWPRPFVVTAAGLLVVSTGFLTVLRPESPRPAGQAVEADRAVPAPERTQLQFSTPGGTRLIWVFDADFDLPGGAR